MPGAALALSLLTVYAAHIRASNTVDVRVGHLSTDIEDIKNGQKTISGKVDNVESKVDRILGRFEQMDNAPLLVRPTPNP